jgi:phosphoserine phosphatase RsbU/P
MSTAADVVDDVPTGVRTSTREERQVRAAENLAVVEDRPRPGLDRVTSLARRVFGVPISTITVLEKDRAWFASRPGLDQHEMQRGDTFCDSTAKVDDLLVVEDALADPAYVDLPAVRDGRVRFYAGEPLRDHEGNVLGVFCLYDDRPRTLDEDQLGTFQEMARWAEQELLASTELAAASEVQAILRPTRALETGDWLVDGDCIPALAVGGDFFDHHVLGRSLFVGIGDVMGKGTAAALLGAGVRGALSGVLPPVHGGADIGDALTTAARGIGADLERAGAFVTLFGGVVDLATGVLRYIDAGMGLCTLRRADGTIERLIGDGRPVGVLPDDEWVGYETTLEPGDRLLLFSDGLLDLLEDPNSWAGPTGELLAQHDDPTSLLRALRRLTAARTGLDDVTAVAVYRR